MSSGKAYCGPPRSFVSGKKEVHAFPLKIGNRTNHKHWTARASTLPPTQYITSGGGGEHSSWIRNLHRSTQDNATARLRSITYTQAVVAFYKLTRSASKVFRVSPRAPEVGFLTQPHIVNPALSHIYRSFDLKKIILDLKSHSASNPTGSQARLSRRISPLGVVGCQYSQSM